MKEPGRHADGGNLYLSVSKTGSKSWLFIYRDGVRQREMGLGSVLNVSLAQAREMATTARQARGAGADPFASRSITRPTFGDVADQHLAAMESGWRNEKHRAQWRMTLTTYAAVLRPMRVDNVSTEDVLGVLRPLWSTKPETASRLRGRIEAVLDAAKARGLRQSENPARWRGHIDRLLPRPKKLTRGHHAAMPYAAVPSFLKQLRQMAGVAPLALEFAILTVARTGETLGGRWCEIDRAQSLWVVPTDRMKGNREHRVPLCARCLEILDDADKMRRSDFIFPGAKKDRPLSNMAFEMLLRRSSVPFTAHGFRSSFRDWAGEETSFTREVAEAALAHLVGDETERAYRRADALQKRRRLMDSWAEYCSGQQS